MNPTDPGRSRLAIVALAVASCAAAAGCASGPADPDGPAQADSTDRQDPFYGNVLHTLGLACESRASALTLPLGTNPGEAPPGWEPRGFYLESSVHLDFWTCERFSWGGFERQDVILVLEGHNHFTPPEACLLGESVLRWLVLANAWVNDAQLAQALHDRWELPVRSADIHLVEDAGAVRTATFQWNTGAGEDNQIRFRQAGSTEGENFHDLRYTYTGEEGLYHWVLRPAPAWPTADIFAATGAVTPPLLSYEVTGGPYVGVAGWYTDTDLPGQFIHFSDPLCEERYT